jgi:UMF1 family MFS transporter
VFVVVSLTLFLPICLEQFARDNGFLQPEKTEPCSSLSGAASASADVRCAVKIGWLWIDTASFRCVLCVRSVDADVLTHLVYMSTQYLSLYRH